MEDVSFLSILFCVEKIYAFFKILPRGMWELIRYINFQLKIIFCLKFPS